MPSVAAGTAFGMAFGVAPALPLALALAALAFALALALATAFAAARSRHHMLWSQQHSSKLENVGSNCLWPALRISFWKDPTETLIFLDRSD